MRYRASELINFATALLSKSGLDPDKSSVVAETLVEADLLGHTTHGLALLAPYLESLEDRGMAKTGEPRVLADFPAAINWDGQLLPGPWLVHRAIDVAIKRAKINGTCTITVRKSHHIACLEA
jgi:L-lactate dehydrogenase